MTYPYSCLHLQNQWAKMKLAQRFHEAADGEIRSKFSDHFDAVFQRLFCEDADPLRSYAGEALAHKAQKARPKTRSAR